MKRIISLVAILLLSGCARQLHVTYLSDPPGAVLYTGGQQMGYTPRTLVYNVSEDQIKSGHMDVASTGVRWLSGATAKNSGLRIDTRNSLYYDHTFNRPEEVPGREKDVLFSLELERTNAVQRQAAAQEAQAAAQEAQAAAQQRQAAALEYRARAPTNCTSTVSGNMVHTSCH